MRYQAAMPGFAPGRRSALRFPRSVLPRTDSAGVMNAPEYKHAAVGSRTSLDVPPSSLSSTAAAAHFPRGFTLPRHAMKTYVATPLDRERNWLLVDAEGQTLGRLA